MSSTKFLVLSNTHNLGPDVLHDADSPLYGLKNTQVDVLLHCGDLTQVGGISAYQKALQMLGSFDAELKLVIAGNHDISSDEEYWRVHLEEDDDPDEHERAVAIMTGDLAKEMGVTYLTEGLHAFTLANGTTFSIYASACTPECGEWAFSYKRSEDRFNYEASDGMTSIATETSAVPDHVDIMMTHGPTKGMLDLIPARNEHAGCDALFKAVQRVRPKVHCFGHIHEGSGVQKIDWAEVNNHTPAIARAVGRTETLMVNAAVMDGSNQSVNRPRIVDLEL